MIILGVTAHYHDSACCLLSDGKLIAAAQEERFTRRKQDPSFPTNAIKFCLKQAALTWADVDCVAYYEKPDLKLQRQIFSLWGMGSQAGQENWRKLDPQRVEYDFKKSGYTGKIFYCTHHESHAASAFFFSGFRKAAIFTVDGVGEWNSTSYSQGDGKELEVFETVDFPNSIGLLYSAITGFLGFEVNEGEYKVMGLAPYGEMSFRSHFQKLLREGAQGSYELNQTYFDFNNPHRMFTEAMVDLLGVKPRAPHGPLDRSHFDIARSLQACTEEIVLNKVRYLRTVVDSDNLCMAGGVALNCVANGRICREAAFRNVFIQPAAGDAGCCLGAAALAHARLYVGKSRRSPQLKNVFLGPEFGPKSINRVVAHFPGARQYRNARSLMMECARRLAAGQILGWFHGRMEFGPRALGGRSILADARRPEMKDRVNALIKKREEFRPFAPAVLAERAAKYFEISEESPFMLKTYSVRANAGLPAVTHIDGSARVQTVGRTENPRFHALLAAFYEITGCAVLMNTSFNVAGEPIVCSPEDALSCFVRADIDCLVLEDTIIDAADVPPHIRDFYKESAVFTPPSANVVYTLF